MSKEMIGCANFENRGNLLLFSINNPDKNLVRRSLEIPVKVIDASINLTLDSEPKGGYLDAYFLFDGSSPNFVLENCLIDKNNRINSIEGLIKKTEFIEKKPFSVHFDIEKDIGLKKFNKDEMDILAKFGYNISSFVAHFEESRLFSHLIFKDKTITLSILGDSSEEDSGSSNILLTTVQKEKLKYWFCSLDNSQQK